MPGGLFHAIDSRRGLPTTAAVATLAGRTAATGRRLSVTFGFRHERAARELELARLRVDVYELHNDVVALLQASLFDRLEALPVDLRDVQQAVLAGHELHEGAVRHDGRDLALVRLADLGHGHDGTDGAQGSVDRLLVRSGDLHDAHVVHLVDGDRGARLLLDALDDLSARADDGADELLADGEGLDARGVRLKLDARLGLRLDDLVKDMQASLLGLCQSALEDLVREVMPSRVPVTLKSMSPR